MELRQSRLFTDMLFPLLKNVCCILKAMQLLAFKLLRLIFGAFQAVYWELNGTAKQVREADDPENYERSAQVLDVRSMFKFADGALFAMEDFICTHNRFESPQYVFDNDNINLMFVTDTHAVFCEPKRKGSQSLFEALMSTCYFWAYPSLYFLVIFLFLHFFSCRFRAVD